MTDARLLAMHMAARTYYAQRLRDADGPRDYLRRRGVPTGAPWWPGYAPGGLTPHLLDLGYTRTELLTGGLVTTTTRGTLMDTFRERVVLPIHAPDGAPVGFLGRAAPGTAGPKYLNSRDSPIFHKGHLLYGATGQTVGRFPVLVEGPLDLFAILRAGDGWLPVATCGTSLTTTHLASLLALPGAGEHGITIAFDDDPAGRDATRRAWTLLAPAAVALWAVTLPDGMDPGDLVDDPDRLGAALVARRPLGSAVIDLELARLVQRHPDTLRFAEGQINTARHLVTLIVDRPPVEIMNLCAHIATRTGAELSTVTDATITALEQR